MLNRLLTLDPSLLRWLDRLDGVQWLVFQLAVLALGIYCMRGMGSRRHF